jgi:hypothetical protein
MSFFAGKRNQRFVNLALAAILAVSTLTASVPFLFANKANAAPGVSYSTVPFTGLGLSTDRSAPSGGSTIGTNSLQLKVDNTHANTSAHFYQTEGLGSAHFTEANSVQATLSVPSDWQNKPVDAGLWGVSTLSTNASEIGWPIIAFISGATDPYLPTGTGFSVYNTFTGAWTTPTDFDASTGWDKTYNLEITYNPSTNNFDFYVNGSLLTSYAASNGVDSYDGLDAVIFDEFNTATNNNADNYTVNWTNFATGNYTPTAPTTLQFKNGSTVIPSGSTFNNTTVTNNTDLEWANGSAEATDAYQTLITYPDGTTSTQWTSTKNLWIGHTAYGNNFFGQKGDGVYSYQVKARSTSTGLWSDWSSVVSLNYDTHSPTAQFTVTPPQYVNGNFHVTGTASDNVKLSNVFFDVRDSSGWVAGCVSGSTVLNYDANQKNATISCDINTASLVEGQSYTLRIHASDNAGYGGGQSTTITVDKTAPSVPVITAPLNNAFFNTSPILDKWNPSADGASGVVNYQIAYNYDDGHSFGGSTCPSVLIAGYSGFIGCRDLTGTSRNHTPAINEQGGVTIWVRAVDNAGNVSNWSTPVHYTYDSTAPTGLANLSPANGTYGTTASLTSIDWTDASDSSTPISYYYESSHSAAVNSDGSFVTPVYQSGALSSSTIPTSGTPEGVYYWHVRAVDAAGNSTAWTTPWKITVDNTAPVVTITSQSNGDLLRGSVTVSGTVTDANPDHYYFVVKDSQGHVVAGPGTVNQATVSDWTWDTTGVADGTYTIDLEARDAANNKDASSVTTVSVTVDNASPVVTITPASGNYGFINTVNIGANIDDAVSYRVLVNGSDVHDGTGAYVPYALSVTDGTYTIQVEATDAAGNVGVSTLNTINIDDTAPALTVTGYNGTSLTPTITGTTDNATDVVTVDGNSATVSSTVNGSGTYDWTYAYPTQSVGTHTSTVVSADTYGNAAGEPVVVTVNSAPATTVTPTGTVTPNITNQGVLGATTTNDGSTTGDTGVKGATDDKVAAAAVNSDANQGKIFGIAWFWWILILAAIAAIAWFIAAAVRRRGEANS